MLPLRNRTLIPRYPLQPLVSKSLTSRKLIGQTFERYVAGSRPCDQLKVIQNHQEADGGGLRPIGLDLINALFPVRSELCQHVLALELLQLSK